MECHWANARVTFPAEAQPNFHRGLKAPRALGREQGFSWGPKRDATLAASVLSLAEVSNKRGSISLIFMFLHPLMCLSKYTVVQELLK